MAFTNTVNRTDTSFLFLPMFVVGLYIFVLCSFHCIFSFERSSVACVCTL